jgi:hypothetical protein
LNEPIDAGSFNQAALDAFGHLLAFENNQDDEATTHVKPPTEYKAGSKWRPFKEGAIAYFNSVKGLHMIPLAYIIREQEIPDPQVVYQSEHHRLISITPLVVIEFEEDNGKVFDFLKSWTLNGPAWTWMRSFNATRNGRASWQALMNHFEGDAQKDRVKDHAYAAIAAAKYYGDPIRSSPLRPTKLSIKTLTQISSNMVRSFRRKNAFEICYKASRITRLLLMRQREPSWQRLHSAAALIMRRHIWRPHYS